MKTTLTAIKADIGSVGGHIRPSQRLLDSVREYIHQHHHGLLIDYHVSYTGDDIALLTTHNKGTDNEEVHRLAWDAFQAGTEVARDQGLYGAGQDLLKDSFSGNVRGLGPAVAEIEIEERPNEPLLFFAADKTDPGAYNLPLYLGFGDPMYCPGLMLSPKMSTGFTFRIMDVSHTEGDKVIDLSTPEELYDIAALLRDPERFVVESIFNRATGRQAVSVSTTRLQNIAGNYVGKDDPILLARVQGEFPASGEALAPYEIAPNVAGFMRGSHCGPLMPARLNSMVSYFDGPPMVSCAAYCVHEGRLTSPVDVFDHPFWDQVRSRVADKASDLRRQGFFGNAMLPQSELEYGGIVHKLEELENRFVVHKT